MQDGGIFNAPDAACGALDQQVQSALRHAVIDAGEFQGPGQPDAVIHAVDRDHRFAADAGQRWRGIHVNHDVVALGRLHRHSDPVVPGQPVGPDAGGDHHRCPPR